MAQGAWQVVTETELFADKYLGIVTQHIKLPSGAVIPDFHLIKSPSWAATIAVTERQELVLVQQYRHAHAGVSLELPAGVIEPNEEPMVAALRELEEETGYSAPGVEPLWTIRPEPSRHQQWAHFGVARDVRLTMPRALDPTEDMSVVLRPLQEFDEIIGEMVHALHVAALLLAVRRGVLVVPSSPPSR
jgi:8-oxo-dGTP pyrophosphatase MutT (NUDIX family)